MLLFALRDAAHGSVFSRKIDAAQWVDGKESAHWAELLGLTDWPPGEDCYKRLRQEYQKRIIRLQAGKAQPAIAN